MRPSPLGIITSLVVAPALIAGAGAGSAAAAPGASFPWAVASQGTAGAGSFGQAVTASPDGSSVVAGQYTGGASFGTQVFSAQGLENGFVAKAGPDGAFAWALDVRSAGSAQVSASARMADGSTLIVGRHLFSDVTIGSITLPINGAFRAGYVAKVTPSGTAAWATGFGGTAGDDAAARGVAALPDGSAVVTGTLLGTAAFGSITVSNPGPDPTGFVAKVRPDGTFAWVTVIDSVGGMDVEGVASVGDGSAVVAGSLAGSVTFGPTTLSASGPNGAAFVARVNPDGTFAWAVGTGGPGGATNRTNGRSVSAFPDGSSVMVGEFSGTERFGSVELSGPASVNGFVARLTPRGAVSWAMAAGGPGAGDQVALTSASALADGSSVVVGSINGSTAFGDIPLSTGVATRVPFVAKINSRGAVAWATEARGGAGAVTGAYDADALPDGSIALSGSTDGPAIFGSAQVSSAPAYAVAWVARALAAPIAPEPPSARAGDGLVTVTPTPLVGPSITSYGVTASPGGRTCTATLPATSCAVTGLVNGTAYRFTATATNAQGTSPASEASAPVTPTGPVRLSARLLPQRARLVSGQPMRLGIRVRNAGTQAATSTRSCIRLPANLRVVRVSGALRSGRTLCFTVGTVAPRGQVTRAITVRADSRRRVTRVLRGSASAAGVKSVQAPRRGVTILPPGSGLPVAG